MLPTGLYVLGTRAGTRRNLMTVSWVTQVALEPKLLGVGVERESVTHRLLSESGVYALSVLPRTERALVRRFAKPVKDQTVEEETGVGIMEGAAVHTEATGAPILEAAAAWLDCEVRHTLALGSHSWFVGEVMDCGSADGDASSINHSTSSGPEEAPVEILRMGGHPDELQGLRGG
jgi:flavin reductase (DIM6/NTAB) family NADH-FMN oxidoreductase RutF